MSNVIDGNYYTKDHEWLSIQGETARLGITDYAQENLGDVVFVELPSVGDEFETGATVATIESVKAVAEVYLPIAGEVSAVNEDLSTDAAILNSSPYESGWLVEFNGFNSSALSDLMDAEAYRQFLTTL
jgi:glycine cleavage system H protein